MKSLFNELALELFDCSLGFAFFPFLNKGRDYLPHTTFPFYEFEVGGLEEDGGRRVFYLLLADGFCF